MSDLNGDILEAEVSAYGAGRFDIDGETIKPNESQTKIAMAHVRTRVWVEFSIIFFIGVMNVIDSVVLFVFASQYHAFSRFPLLGSTIQTLQALGLAWDLIQILLIQPALLAWGILLRCATMDHEIRYRMNRKKNDHYCFYLFLFARVFLSVPPTISIVFRLTSFSNPSLALGNSIIAITGLSFVVVPCLLRFSCVVCICKGGMYHHVEWISWDFLFSGSDRLTCCCLWKNGILHKRVMDYQQNKKIEVFGPPKDEDERDLESAPAPELPDRSSTGFEKPSAPSLFSAGRNYTPDASLYSANKAYAASKPYKPAPPSPPVPMARAYMGGAKANAGMSRSVASGGQGRFQRRDLARTYAGGGFASPKWQKSKPPGSSSPDGTGSGGAFAFGRRSQSFTGLNRERCQSGGDHRNARGAGRGFRGGWRGRGRGRGGSTGDWGRNRAGSDY